MIEQDSDPRAAIRQPPESVGGILKQLGPGLIIAGSIVGSGELIATTAVGAKTGFTLLWLIIIGCIIKVFVQIEFGKYSIVNGRTTMDGLNEVPGPRFQVNWVSWCWLIFILVALAQLGGIVGGVGQALAIQQPITEAGREVNDYNDAAIGVKVNEALITELSAESEANRDKIATLEQSLKADKALLAYYPTESDKPTGHDDKIWATFIALGTIVLLVIGRYRFIQSVSTLLVAAFTFLTIGNLIHLQSLPEWRVTWVDLAAGMSFNLGGREGIITALSAFGIIGVGATELIQYPYWCLEKGYARWTGPREETDEWAKRAAGWLRVLKWDAWCSMVVYTFATIAFYLLGAAILHRTNLNPEGGQMVRTLSEMYVPVFGEAAQLIFLLGAFAVLYSTFFVATASHARVCADALRVFGISKGSEISYRRAVKVLCIVFPLLFLLTYLFIPAPKALVLAGGFMGALMLPLLGIASLYFRYKRSDQRLTPGRTWDIFLWISVFGLVLAGAYAFYAKVFQELTKAAIGDA